MSRRNRARRRTAAGKPTTAKKRGQRSTFPTYRVIVADTGVDPDKIAAVYELRQLVPNEISAGYEPACVEQPDQPRTIRDAYEVITGRTDFTAWSQRDALALRARLDGDHDEPTGWDTQCPA